MAEKGCLMGSGPKSSHLPRTYPGDSGDLPRRFGGRTADVPRNYVEPTAELRRAYPGATSSLPRNYVEPIGDVPRSYAEPTAVLYPCFPGAMFWLCFGHVREFRENRLIVAPLGKLGALGTSKLKTEMSFPEMQNTKIEALVQNKVEASRMLGCWRVLAIGVPDHRPPDLMVTNVCVMWGCCVAPWLKPLGSETK